MSLPTRLYLILAVTAAFVVLLVLAHELTVASRPPRPAAAGTQSEEAPPKSIREAYQRAENFGEEPASPAPPVASPASPAPRFDSVHYLGLAAALLMLAGLGTGLWLYLVVAFRPGKDRLHVRRLWRRGHYALGLAAGVLALSYLLGRILPASNFGLGFSVPTVIAGLIILLAISGLLRAWPPRALARSCNWWTWSHRAFAALVVIMLLWYGIMRYAPLALHK